MKRNVILCLIIFFLWNCEKKDYERQPKSLIPKAEFTHIVADIIILNTVKEKYFKDNHILPMDLILNKYCIDSIILSENITYYASNPKLMVGIVKNADSIIKLKKQKINAPAD